MKHCTWNINSPTNSNKVSARQSYNCKKQSYNCKRWMPTLLLCTVAGYNQIANSWVKSLIAKGHAADEMCKVVQADSDWRQPVGNLFVLDGRYLHPLANLSECDYSQCDMETGCLPPDEGVAHSTSEWPASCRNYLQSVTNTRKTNKQKNPWKFIHWETTDFSLSQEWFHPVFTLADSAIIHVTAKTCPAVICMVNMKLRLKQITLA